MNSNKNKKLHFAELLSPAGNSEGFYGAIAAGADAVYLAGNRFGARAYADNFSTEELIECIQYAHILGRKVYMTVNTLLKEAEIHELYEYLFPFYEAGLDAVIVQDLGVLRLVRSFFPDLEIHVSTQMTICDGQGAKLLKTMGACRIVPARELSLREISAMKEMADVEIETFIHGAMCYCYSGQCLFSSILGGRSGNRGRCAQPCRLPYTVNTGNIRREDCYPLSLKDMCTIEHIPQLIEAGIDSFKIEGRMKKPEYTAGVTDVYRRNMDRYYEMRERLGVEEAIAAYHVNKRDFNTLKSLYIRSDIQDGYYYKHNGKEMVTFTNPAYSGSDESLLAKVHDAFLTEHKKLKVVMDAGFETGRKAWVAMRVPSLADVAIVAEGDIVQAAQKQPITEENVVKQLNKLGDTGFFAENVNVHVSRDAFYPLKQINELRRMAVEKLEQEIIEGRGYICRTGSACNDYDMNKAGMSLGDETYKEKKGYVVSVRAVEQLEAFAAWIKLQQNENRNIVSQMVRLYIDGDMAVDDWEKIEPLIRQLPVTCLIWIALPYIIRRNDEAYMNRLYQLMKAHKIIIGVLARSMDGLGFVKQWGDISCRTDAGVYIWNNCALEEIAELTDGFCMPYELKGYEQKELTGKIPCEKIVYSRIPMMITANCVLRTTDKCDRTHGRPAVLTDRYHKDFRVYRNCEHCYNIIYNSVPFSLHQECDKWRDYTDLRLDFTYEEAEEVHQVLNAFVKRMPLGIKDYTTGHEKRGVE